MSNHPNRSRACRPREMLRVFASHFPDLFDEAAAYRAAHRDEWPPWCYCPSGVTYAHVVARAYPRETVDASLRAFLRACDDDVAIDAELAPILCAWRMGMGVYRFDPALAAALVDTPATTLPAEALCRLPEWCLYVETPWWPDAVGFFACLDRDGDESLLRLMYDRGELPPSSYPLPLDAPTIDDALAARRQYALDLAREMGDNRPAGSSGRDGGALEPYLPGCVSLLLYLCDQAADYSGDDRPGHPRPVKTKKGWRLFSASAPRFWEIGRTIGERLRQAQAAHRNMPEERAAPAPHLRRAHWHTYRVGKGRQDCRVRWLHPILVGHDRAETDARLDRDEE